VDHDVGVCSVSLNEGRTSWKIEDEGLGGAIGYGDGLGGSNFSLLAPGNS